MLEICEFTHDSDEVKLVVLESLQSAIHVPFVHSRVQNN